MLVGILGATGTTGKEIIKILEEGAIKITELYLFSSTPEHEIKFLNKSLKTQSIEDFIKSNKFIDILFSCASSEVSEKYIHQIQSKVGLIIDKTEFFRKNAPLIIPEINKNEILDIISLNNFNKEIISDRDHITQNIISSPNCIAIPIAVFLNPIKKYVKRVVISTYQSCSGAGKLGLDKLHQEVVEIINKCNLTENFDEYIKDQNKNNLQSNINEYFAFNAIPQIGSFNINFNTNEEDKVINEVQKVLNLDIPIFITCVRIPTIIGHSISINIELNDLFEEEILNKAPHDHDMNFIEKIYNILESQDGINIKKTTEFETPIGSIVNDVISVGRIRRDLTVKNGFSAWISSNNLRKGAALNAVQIAKIYIDKINLDKLSIDLK